MAGRSRNCRAELLCGARQSYVCRSWRRNLGPGRMALGIRFAGGGRAFRCGTGAAAPTGAAASARAPRPFRRRSGQPGIASPSGRPFRPSPARSPGDRNAGRAAARNPTCADGNHTGRSGRGLLPHRVLRTRRLANDKEAASPGRPCPAVRGARDRPRRSVLASLALPRPDQRRCEREHPPRRRRRRRALLLQGRRGRYARRPRDTTCPRSPSRRRSTPTLRSSTPASGPRSAPSGSSCSWPGAPGAGASPPG